MVNRLLSLCEDNSTFLFIHRHPSPCFLLPLLSPHRAVSIRSQCTRTRYYKRKCQIGKERVMRKIYLEGQNQPLKLVTLNVQSILHVNMFFLCLYSSIHGYVCVNKDEISAEMTR